MLLGNGCDLAAVLSGNVRQLKAAFPENLLRCAIAFRMHGGVVQRILCARHTEESGALFIRLGSQLCHLFQLFPVSEYAVFRPVRHDVLGDGLVDAGDVGQQGERGGVQVYAYVVHAVLHHAVQRRRQLRLGHIVLILSHADRLRVDLHQFRQRVL